MLQQLFWLAGVLLVLWFVALNPIADRIMCAVLGRLLRRSQTFRSDTAELLLQCPSGYGVYRIRVSEGDRYLLRASGQYLTRPEPAEKLESVDEIYAYGPDQVVARLRSAGQ